MKCKVDGCFKEVRGSGKRKVKNPDALIYCEMHVARLKRNGSLDAKFEYNYGTTEQRFWMYTDKRSDDECWTFKKVANSTGYAGIWDSEEMRKKLAHRYSYELANGKIDGDVYIMHTCDNRLCVNPKHLVVGTPKENYDDMIKKGRGVRVFKPGTGHPNSKLTEEKVRYIRDNAEHMTHDALAEMVGGVSRVCITDVLRRKTWKHID